MSDKKFLEEQSHETLVTFIMNSEMREDMLRDRLYLLSGCRYFGESDGMNGSCVDCLNNNPGLHERCCLFHIAAHQYLAQKYSKVREKYIEYKNHYEQPCK